VDVAVLAIPRAGVLDAVRGLAARKVGGVVIFSAGFAEGGEEGLAEQREIARLAAGAGMVVEGPNCLGMVNYVDRIPLTFVEVDAVPPAGRRAVGIVSQSGAMAAVLGTTLLARECGVSYSVSTGNEAASGVEDFVDWLVDDPHTHAIAMIVEQFRKPQAFLAAARRAHAAGKPVVLLHPGKSSAARESAATHTGAMAGDYKLMRAMVARAGVIFAETLEELADIAEIAARCPILPSGQTAVLGESGAFKALTLDLAEELGLPSRRCTMRIARPARGPAAVRAGVQPARHYRARVVGARNLYPHARSPARRSPRGHGHGRDHPGRGGDLRDQVSRDPRCRRGQDPDQAADLCRARRRGTGSPERIAALRAAGIPWFPTTERALRAITRLTHWAARDHGVAEVPPLGLPGLADEMGVIPEYRAKALLGPAGVAFPRGQFAASAQAAVAAAEAVGYPVAMKAQAAALGHKSDAGGVILNLADGAAVHEAWSRIHANVAAYDGTIALDGVLIEGMGKRGLEMIVGARNDPEWGPVILAGFGGVTAEILQDVRLLTADLTQEAVEAELMQLASAALLAGYRGAPALDVPALAALIVKVGQVLRAEPSIREIDLNPVILHPRGGAWWRSMP
jgi:acyl-CoA synthetase (NDP forming)